MPELAGDCPKISLGEFFLDASVPNGPNYNTPELIGDLKKLTGPSTSGCIMRLMDHASLGAIIREADLFQSC